MSQIDSAYTKVSSDRVQQGDILRRVLYPYPHFDEGLKVIQYDVTLPYIVVLTQDCDLKQDFLKREIEKEGVQDHFLHAILVCPAYPSRKFREGTYLDHWGKDVKMSRPDHYDSIIKKNMHKRYHHLAEDRGNNVPELVLDFKHYYAIHVEILSKMKAGCYVASIRALFREELAQRFSYYLSRIGLPDSKSSDKSEQVPSANAD